MRKVWKVVLIFDIILAFLFGGYFAISQIEVSNLEDETIEVNSGSVTVPRFIWWGKDVSDKMHVEGQVDTSRIGVYELKYSWFIFSFTKNVIVQDTVKPDLVLEGDTVFTLSDFGKFEEPGFFATDNFDGDLTSKVRVRFENSVEDGVQVFRVIYTVQDSSGNVSTSERKVFVTKGRVYLTFDDGPNSKITPEILDTLKKYNVKATFFLLSFEGDSVKEALVSRMIEEGHTVAIHGVSHEYKDVYKSIDALMDNFYGMQEQIFNVTGVTTNLVRFPGGSSNTVSKKYTPGIMTEAVEKLSEAGFVYFDWNVDSDDAGGAKTAAEIYSNVTKAIRDERSNVVLMHDSGGHYATSEALEDIIQWCLENGYELLPLNEEAYTAHHKLNN